MIIYMDKNTCKRYFDGNKVTRNLEGLFSAALFDIMHGNNNENLTDIKCDDDKLNVHQEIKSIHIDRDLVENIFDPK